MFQAADPRDRSFDAQAEASVRNAAVATKVQVPLIIILVQAVAANAGYSRPRSSQLKCNG